MSFINSLENRFGRHAIPGIVAILAWFQVAVWILIQFRPDFVESLVLFPPLVWEGQVWRLVTWVFMPSTNSPIWMLFAVLIMLMFSRALDEAWGPFRVNLYVIGGFLSMTIGSMLFNSIPLGFMLYNSIFFAFAALVPNMELMVFFILPVKVKWLAALSAAGLAVTFARAPSMRMAIIFSIVNFFVAFGPQFLRWMKQRGVVAERRARFEYAKAPEGDWLHKCHSCGKTDLDDPKLDFRVAADGEDYCDKCRPKKPVSGAGV